jgi:hypothetical protein
MTVYEKLLKEIENIKIIDDHGHPGIAEYYEDLPKEFQNQYWLMSSRHLPRNHDKPSYNPAQAALFRILN